MGVADGDQRWTGHLARLFEASSFAYLEFCCGERSWSAVEAREYARALEAHDRDDAPALRTGDPSFHLIEVEAQTSLRAVPEPERAELNRVLEHVRRLNPQPGGELRDRDETALLTRARGVVRSGRAAKVAFRRFLT